MIWKWMAFVICMMAMLMMSSTGNTWTLIQTAALAVRISCWLVSGFILCHGSPPLHRLAHELCISQHQHQQCLP
ncbi:hypothetical protein H257_03497 [Aphanomyces astaci]|uniref:Secreted protein n=1 Tax=Aphanomyces astaci TaxID=112090 RepID=W4GYZ4_APHAT|nr:hypothetical protein H257_03497 [Aphanomyces astaci]ETV84234.1 hypothetical protein H257_03497 [Aphanomyces astaci]|eukprot:XP_009825926.1 hypothetical protein H257_03497 [Aphanomyces astaci]